MSKIVEDFKNLCNNENHTKKRERENLLKQMTNKEIDELINWQPNIYGKIYYSKFKKK